MVPEQTDLDWGAVRRRNVFRRYRSEVLHSKQVSSDRSASGEHRNRQRIGRVLGPSALEWRGLFRIEHLEIQSIAFFQNKQQLTKTNILQTLGKRGRGRVRGSETYIYIYIYIYIQRCAKSFIQNALKLSETPVPLRLLDIIPPSRWSNVCAVNPFNVISLLVRGNYSAGFSMGIVRSSWSIGYSATPLLRHALYDELGLSMLY